jgi:fucose permease
MTSDGESAVAPETVVALSERAQRVNSWMFILNNSLGFLVAPVFYVGILHATILSDAGFSNKVANLPSSVYGWAAPMPVLIAWLWPSTRYFRRLWVLSYLLKGGTGVLAALLFYAAPTNWQAAGLLLHALCIGVSNGMTNMCQWELIGRGMTAQRKAWTLGATFGVGPIFAVVGSCASQLILKGDFFGWIRITPLGEPLSYIVLFGATGPAMLVSAVAAWFASLPAEEEKPRTASFAETRSGLKQYFTNRLILIALIGFLLTMVGGNHIMNNLALFARDATGNEPKDYAGIQFALRFGCKSLFGFVLGWLLARFYPRLPALATTLACVAGLVWALLVPGEWYLFSFGLLGAGELSYVYYLNYIVGCSPLERVRENTAYTNVLIAGIAFMPLVYGAISDAYGFKASFVTALGILAVTVLVVATLLPKQPRRSG